jgi:hypothetical protein
VSDLSQRYKRIFLGVTALFASLAVLWRAAYEYLLALRELGFAESPPLPIRFLVGLVGLEISLSIILVGIWWVIWQPAVTASLTRWILAARKRVPWLGWLLSALLLLALIYVLQHIHLSAVLGFTARLVLGIGTGIALAVLTGRHSDRLVSVSSLVIAWLATAGILSFSQAFVTVSTYPFSLYWSEGNRFWDYSVLFGHRLYNYPADKPIFAYLDLGRQTLWGLPFLFARIPIWAFRLWNGLVSTVPYAVLGWLAFQRLDRKNWVWFLCGVWTFLFLNQGPIYTPLVLSACLVAIAWRKPLWLALPLVVVASYYAQLTRFTWTFAPAIWGAMLFFSDLKGTPNREGETSIWRRWNWGASIAVFLSGVFGGYLLPRWLNFDRFIAALESPAGAQSGAAGIDIGTLSGLGAFLSRQPLLWERLLPNPTFGPGIILALLIASLPLVIFLVYLIKSRQWPLDLLRGLVILLPLLAFLVIGLVASVKIGGGGDLHNMDMFLVTLVFTSALAWRAGAFRAVFGLERQPTWVQGLWIVMVLIFAQQAMLDSTPVRIPTPAKAQEALAYIQKQVNDAEQEGEILFLDQRQLLTFGNVPSIPLVVEYEKKYLMDQALANAADYFANFHADLARQRFKLIISEPLKIVMRGEDYHFGDENDAWVKWVAQPILCYYEPVKTFKEVKVQVLVPRSDPIDCPP